MLHDPVLVCIAVALLLIATVMISRVYVGPMALVGLELLLAAVGTTIMVLERRVGADVLWAFLAAWAALLLGYSLWSRAPRRPTEMRPVLDSAVWAVVSIAGGLAIYHLVAGGIPLF